MPLQLLRLLTTEQQPRPAVSGVDAYKLRPTLLTPGGRALFAVLQTVLPEGHVVVPEVAFISLFDVKPGEARQAARNRIIQKRVDFVVYEQVSMKPICAIELDDASHAEPARKSRDAFADELFGFVGMPLVHIRAASHYDTSDVARVLAKSVRPRQTT